MQDDTKKSLFNTHFNKTEQEHQPTITSITSQKLPFRMLTTSVLLASSLILLSACSDGDDDDDAPIVMDDPFIGPPVIDPTGDGDGDGDTTGGDDGDDDVPQIFSIQPGCQSG